MGLDQYAYKRARKEYISKDQANESLEEITYWRKHNRLQSWMENLWIERGEEDDINCRFLQLYLEDIENLEKAIELRNLPETEGFFFGKDSYQYKSKDGMTYEDYENDMNFIKQAKEALKNNYDVFYSCWY